MDLNGTQPEIRDFSANNRHQGSRSSIAHGQTGLDKQLRVASARGGGHVSSGPHGCCGSSGGLWSLTQASPRQARIVEMR